MTLKCKKATNPTSIPMSVPMKEALEELNQGIVKLYDSLVWNPIVFKVFYKRDINTEHIDDLYVTKP